jgi:hypothetical protein
MVTKTDKNSGTDDLAKIVNVQRKNTFFLTKNWISCKKFGLASLVFNIQKFCAYLDGRTV